MKCNLFKLTLLVLLLLDTLKSTSQAQNPLKLDSLRFPMQTLNSQLGSAMPNAIPMSPEVASMAKYSGYSVNYFNGLPDISISLFEIKSKTLNVPIVLKYHSSGIKVTDVATCVGLGWTVVAGGEINRKVLGKPDEEVSSTIVYDADTLDLSNDNEYIYYIADSFNKTFIDTEPDLYYYNFPGGSGSFQYINGDIVFMPLAPLKAVGVQKLIDSGGKEYYFGYGTNPQTYFPSRSGTDPVSTWLLTKIINENKTDSISFTYQSAGNGTLFEDNIDYYIVEDLPGSTNQCQVENFYSSINTVSEVYQTDGDQIVNSEIEFNGGKISFILSEDSRLDRANDFKSLDTIKIYSDSDIYYPIKYIIFHTGYFVNGSIKRLRLDSLEIADKNKTVIECYRFSYNTNISLPSYTSKEKDWWGYYNGKNNSTLIPRQQVPYDYSLEWIGSDYTDGRDPDTSKMQAYILKSITYPTGGHSIFKYETNSYYDNGNLKFAGGLRIKKIVTDDNNGGVLTRTFQYNQSRLNSFFDNCFFKTTTTIINSVSDGLGCLSLLSKRSTIYTSNPSVDINPYDGSPVVYPEVTEYYGDENTNSGKTVYHYSDNMDSKVVLSNHFDTYYAPQIMTERTHDEKLKLINKSFERGLLLGKTIFKNENGQYKKVTEVENQYGAFPSKTIFNAGFVSWRSDIYGGGNPSFWRSEYEFDNYYAYTADDLLKSSIIYTYNQNEDVEFVTQETYYDYNDSLYLQVSEVKQIQSNGDTLYKIIKYPTDFLTGIYPTMVNNNIISKPVEEHEYLNSNPIKKSRGFYNQIFELDSIDEMIGAGPNWETKLRYLEYDTHGNLLSWSKDKDIIVNYIWGYNNTYPVAELKNATYSEVNSLTPNISLLETGNPTEQQRIRSGLPDALITFYTYKPLIGMTSQTDPNGITTFFEYDSFNRLYRIFDQNNKVIKEYKYNYASH